jgi:phosphomannose isomerase type I
MILFLKPYFEIKPWAGDDLNKIYDCPEQSGEAWIISGFKNKSSIIINGKYKGQTLRNMWINHPELFGNFPDKEFPLLVKLISAKDNLSIQVHPNDDYALKTKNSLGKFECWYILPETTTNKITIGVNAKSASEMRNIINKGLVEEFLINKPIEKDDLIIVEPGTVHAIRGGTFLLEVQESSDITYRLFDFNREPRRELHIEDSLNVIDFNNLKNRIFKFQKNDKFENKHFNMYKFSINGMQKYENKCFMMVYILSGLGKINGVSIKKGDAFILTKDSEEIIFEGQLEVMLVEPKPKDKERLRMRKIALITGLTNQDGYYLAKLLLEKNYEVHGIIQSKSQLTSRFIIEFNNNENFFTHIGDLTDASNLNRIVESIKPDEIYHLASQSHVDVSFDMPEYTTEVNCLGTLRLLDAIKSSEIRTKLFSLSSPYMFSGNIFPQNENTAIDPKSPYAISKVYAYQMGKCYRDNYNLFITNGICYNHESKLRDESFVAMKIISNAKMIRNGQKKILELGNLNARREWGHAEDYAYAMWLSLQQDKPNDYIISTGCSYTVREFVQKVYNKIGIDIRWVGVGLDEKGLDAKTGETLISVSLKYIRPNDIDVLYGDSTKFKNDTGHIFKYDLDKLIDSLLEE